MPDAASIRHVSRELIRELGFLDARYTPADVSHAECHALVELDRRGPMSPSEIADALRLDKSRVSRLVAALEDAGWVRVAASGEDARGRVVTLTSAGHKKVALIHASANERVDAALAFLSSTEREAVEQSIATYATALGRARRAALYTMRPIRRIDREGVAKLIQTVMPEIGAVGPGFALSDPEVNDMPAAYGKDRCAYYVVVPNDESAKGPSVVGGGGMGPLAGAPDEVCELRKMYFLPATRGLGLAKRVLDACLDAARNGGFRTMYLETMPNLTAAMKLYEQNGFRRISERVGSTGHFGCKIFFARDL